MAWDGSWACESKAVLIALSVREGLLIEDLILFSC